METPSFNHNVKLNLNRKLNPPTQPLDKKMKKNLLSPREMESVEEENSRIINLTDSDDAEFASLEGDDKQTLVDKKK